MLGYPQLVHLSVPELIGAAGGDPRQIDATVQAGAPGEISEMAASFRNADVCVTETGSTSTSSDTKSRELQTGINLLAQELGVHPITVGIRLRTSDDLNIFVDDDPGWGKRRVRELAAKFRVNKPEDVALLPDIGEPL
jgi:Hydrolase N-terminal helical domain